TSTVNRSPTRDRPRAARVRGRRLTRRDPASPRLALDLPVGRAGVDATTPQVAGADPGPLALLALAGDLARAELVRHRRHHHAGREEQPALEPQGRLVVQELLPPATDDVLRDVDRDHTARVGLPDLGGVVDDRLDDLAVGREEHL